ncbi:MAG: Asp-tRNA(Asn)/Glu-tRNA(Gln) amidotransferase subunit GatC [Candidatus Shapirobacteria bacterium]|jgi:aspartyl-tRNA(Asn)/glutamyl-tRNA(Gln) amidotransferase subunit C
MSSVKITVDTLDHIAHLARISLTDTERELFLPQLSSILEYVEVLQKVDTSNINASSQITNLKNITRPDEVKPSLSQSEVLSQSPKSNDGYFQVHNTIPAKGGSASGGKK